MVSNFSFLQEFVTGEFALAQVLSVVLFAFLILTVVSLVKYYIPEEIDSSFKVLSTLALAVAISFFSYFTYILPITDLFLNLALSLSLGLCLMHPSIALANLAGYLLLRPWELLEQPEFEILPRTFLLLFLISLVFNFFQTGRVRVNTSRPQLLIIILGAWVFLSTLISGDVVESQSIFFEKFLKSIMIAVFMFQTIKKEEDYKLFTSTIVTAAIGLSIFALINTYFIVQTDRLEGRGTIQNANDLASLLIFVLPLSLRPILKKQLNFTAMFVSAIVIAILALGVWKAQSRASYLSIMLMAMTFFVYHFRKHKVLLVQMAVVAVIGFAFISQSNLGRDESDIADSKMNRLGYWKAGVSMALRNPLLGVGFYQYPKNYIFYGAAAFTETGHRTAHSSWILLLSEAGFPALALFGVLFYQAVLRAWSLFKSAPELLLMLVGYGVCMTFLSHTYSLYPYILLALVFTYPIPTEEVRHENSVA